MEVGVPEGPLRETRAFPVFSQLVETDVTSVRTERGEIFGLRLPSSLYLFSAVVLYFVDDFSRCRPGHFRSSYSVPDSPCVLPRLLRLIQRVFDVQATW